MFEKVIEARFGRQTSQPKSFNANTPVTGGLPIKYDKLYLESLETGADVQRACQEFIHYYNHKRDHSSIGNQPPMVFYSLAA